MAKNFVAKRLEVNGIVQGVGFRPFVYNLARSYRLTGQVANTSGGVIIHIEGPIEKVDSFLIDISCKHPPLAQIVELEQLDDSVRGFSEFSIVKSRQDASMSTLISPDVSVCADCRQELFDSRDRRYGYPFINCTNCGPRYTIIDDIPYDRPKTSMKLFKMCPQCQAEYDDPTNRRFHAQPNACQVCGPHVSLYDSAGNPVRCEDPIEKTAELLKAGKICAIKGLGGFHLAADAENTRAVERLRRRKHREEKPLALMSLDTDSVRNYARLNESDIHLIESIQRPIVLLLKKEPNTIASSVSPRNRFFGVMLPYTPLHYLLISQGFTALVMTSGNLSEEPIAIDNQDAFKRLKDIADYFLIHNRDIYLRSDDSIVRNVAGSKRLMRRSRGYVPVPVFLKDTQPPILACGAELKNTVCLTRGRQAFLSQHIGDLENLSTYDFFQLTIRHMQRSLEVKPERIAYDMHPDYLSTRWALEQHDLSLVPIQHHHAHIVSSMAENKVDGPVIGISCDGTGYGTDGNIWGGEVLISELHSFERAAHFDYVPLPGSTAAIKQPWRMAVSYLQRTFSDDLWNLGLPLITETETERLRTIIQMIERGLNSPLTSSLGRLFDGVAAIMGIRSQVAFEGQAAMELEMIAGKAEGSYEHQLEGLDPIRILPQPIVRGVVMDMAQKKDHSLISAKFHNTIIALLVDICAILKKQHGLNRVAISGGVFQNAILLSGLVRTLEKRQFEVYTQKLVPCNDGGISLGQAIAAAVIA